MGEMQAQMEAFIQFVRGEMARGIAAPDERKVRNAIVRLSPRPAIKVEK
jgi:hypothetical protein